MILILFTYMSVIIYNQSNSKFTDANSNIYFMTSQETAKFLYEDPDHYVKNMSMLDLKARKVNSHQEYINGISSLSISFTKEEQDILAKCAHSADMFLRNTSFSGLSYGKHLDGQQIANIRWVFAYTHNEQRRQYEEGLPHTRAHIIFLSKYVMKYNELDLTNTLIHEKIHIYQRYNPELFKTILSSLNYKPLDMTYHPNKQYIRANPDTDGKVYYNILTGKEMICLYRNDNPNSINDVIVKNFALEHPYEQIAYEIAEYYYRENALHKDIKNL